LYNNIDQVLLSTNKTIGPVGFWRIHLKKQPYLTAQTRQNLIDAFWSFYSQKRIEKITVKEITEKAGYNRGTFYEYYTDVYDVLEQIENSLIPGIDELPPVNKPLDSTSAMPIDMFLKMYEKNNQYYSLLLGENGNPAFAGKLKKAVKPIISEAFLAKSLDKAELDYILEFVLSAMIGILGYWFKENQGMSAEKLIALIYDLMENGALKRLK
jgi:AcrR family transcriptional regulator